MNTVIILGRLGRDPDVRQTQNNTVATLNVATSEKYKDRNGNTQENTQWHRVTVWGKMAEMCGKYLSKGREVLVEGKLQTRQYEDKQGQKQYVTEIVAKNVQFIGGMDKRQQPDNDLDAALNDFGAPPQFDYNQEIPF